MTCPDCDIELRPWFDHVPSSAGCRVVGVRCGGCNRFWSSARTERIYDDIHSQMETTFRKMIGFMDFPMDAKEEKA